MQFSGVLNRVIYTIFVIDPSFIMVKNLSLQCTHSIYFFYYLVFNIAYLYLLSKRWFKVPSQDYGYVPLCFICLVKNLSGLSRNVIINFYIMCEHKG